MRNYAWIALMAVALDQVSKWGARRLTAPLTLIPGVIRLRYTENTGMAFSLFSGRPWLLVILSLALVTLGALALHRYQLGTLSKTAAMMMLGGAVGNLIDRVFLGYVVDMVEVLFVSFAIFNVADMFLTIGCILMAASLLWRPQEWSERDGHSRGNPA